MGWAIVSETIPLYPLYALLFADAGMSSRQISSLFLVWSVVGVVAEVPSGACADRFSRRSALIAAGLLQAAAYVLWITVGSYAGFAVGFALWALGSACSSGAFEALLYEAMAAAGREGDYPRLYGRVVAVEHLSQVPAATAATVLFTAGGYPLVGWASVGCCVAAAVLAARLPETRAVRRGAAAEGAAVLRDGLREIAGRPALRGAIAAVALLGGLDGLEEYFPGLARSWGVGAAAVPLVLLSIPLAGAAGSALAGRLGSRLRPPSGRELAAAVVGAIAVFGLAAWAGRPPALAGLALAYGAYHFVLVVVDTRLQGRIEGPARATVTSLASLGTELCAVGVFVPLALGQAPVVAAGAVAIGLGLPRLLAGERGCTSRPLPGD